VSALILDNDIDSTGRKKDWDIPADMSLVYEKEWSAAKLHGGMVINDEE
jgi:hypothetical protein